MRHCLYCNTPTVEGSTCPKALVCPDCDAGPGRPCRRPSGHRAAELHAARWALAELTDWNAGVRYEGQERPPGVPPDPLPGQTELPT